MLLAPGAACQRFLFEDPTGDVTPLHMRVGRRRGRYCPSHGMRDVGRFYFVNFMKCAAFAYALAAFGYFVDVRTGS